VPERLVTMGQRPPWRSHRGAILVLTGILSIAYGYAIDSEPNIPSLHRTSYAYDLLSPRGWSILFMVIGGLTVAGSVFRFDRWFFALSSGLFGSWTAFYLVAWLRGNAPSSAWLSSAIFGAFTMILVICAGWDDEPLGWPPWRR
jgi:hypothetical protein